MDDDRPITLVVTDHNTKAKTATLAFRPYEKEYVESLISAVHDLRKRDDISVLELQLLATFLRAAERLPMITESVSIWISLVNNEPDGSWGCYSTHLSDTEFELQTSERIECGVGTDIETLNDIRVGVGWRLSHVVEVCWEEWLEEFQRRARDSDIEVRVDADYSDIDWHAAESGTEYWHLLPEDGYS